MQNQEDWDESKDGCDNFAEIYVGNLPTSCTEPDISSIFSVGKYKVLDVVIKRLQDCNKVYAFVKFANHEQAKSAVKEYENVILSGRKLVLNSARRKPVVKTNKRCSNKKQEEISGSRAVNGFGGEDEAHDSDKPPPLGPIPKHLIELLQKYRTSLANKSSLSAIKITRQFDSENRRVENGDAASKTPIPDSNLMPRPALLPDPYIGRRQISPVNTNDNSGSVSTTNARCDPLAKVIICDFPVGTTEDELSALFCKYRPIKCLIMSNSEMEAFTYAYMFLANGRVAAIAVPTLNGTVFKGQKISIKHDVIPEDCL